MTVDDEFFNQFCNGSEDAGAAIAPFDDNVSGLASNQNDFAEPEPYRNSAGELIPITDERHPEYVCPTGTDEGDELATGSNNNNSNNNNNNNACYNQNLMSKALADFHADLINVQPETPQRKSPYPGFAPARSFTPVSGGKPQRTRQTPASDRQYTPTPGRTHQSPQLQRLRQSPHPKTPQQGNFAAQSCTPEDQQRYSSPQMSAPHPGSTPAQPFTPQPQHQQMRSSPYQASSQQGTAEARPYSARSGASSRPHWQTPLQQQQQQSSSPQPFQTPDQNMSPHTPVQRMPPPQMFLQRRVATPGGYVPLSMQQVGPIQNGVGMGQEAQAKHYQLQAQIAKLQAEARELELANLHSSPPTFCSYETPTPVLPRNLQQIRTPVVNQRMAAQTPSSAQTLPVATVNTSTPSKKRVRNSCAVTASGSPVKRPRATPKKNTRRPAATPACSVTPIAPQGQGPIGKLFGTNHSPAQLLANQVEHLTSDPTTERLSITQLLKMRFLDLSPIDKARLLLPLLNGEDPLTAEKNEQKYGPSYGAARQVLAMQKCDESERAAGA